MKKIVRLTESDLVRLVKRVINEQMTISDKPYIPNVTIGGKNLKEGDKILISNKEIDTNSLKRKDYIVNSYYGTISEIEELSDGEFTIAINGGYVPTLYLQKAVEDKSEPMVETKFSTSSRPCLRITLDRKPSSLGKINLKRGQEVPVLVFASLDENYLRNPRSSCESKTSNEKLRDMGIKGFK